MKARVITSGDLELRPGEIYEITNVISEDDEGPELFEIKGDNLPGGNTVPLICNRDGCSHLTGGQWEIIKDESERG